MNRFDRAFWKRVWSLVRLYWLSAERRHGVKLLACVAVLAGVGLAVGAYATYLNRDISNALVGKHLTQFYHMMLLAAAAAAVGVLAKVLEEYVGSQPLLVRGLSGTGKTSLIRALAGIWREGSGTVTRPPLCDVMFLPQRPYMILGSLRDQLTYPRAAGASDEKVYETLRAVNLSDLPERFGGLEAEMHWADVLSPGEQQRIAFARLLLNRPRYAFLDEATSALDVANEQLMYELLNSQGIPFLSSGHRPTLLKFHRNILQLSTNHTWKVEPSPQFDTLTSAA